MTSTTPSPFTIDASIKIMKPKNGNGGLFFFFNNIFTFPSFRKKTTTTTEEEKYSNTLIGLTPKAALSTTAVPHFLELVLQMLWQDLRMLRLEQPRSLCLSERLGLSFVSPFLGQSGRIEDMVHGMNYALAAAGIISSIGDDLVVSKWLLSKGQVLTMGTCDTLLLALDMDRRVDEAETIWKMILQTHTRSISKRLFSRMIALYDHHHHPENILEVFADMEELEVKPDQDTIQRIARAFEKLGHIDKQKLLLKKYQNKWKYLHFNGERVRVQNTEYLNQWFDLIQNGDYN